MSTLISDKKYTVILSAYQTSNTQLQNLIDTELLRHQLESELHVHPIRATGVYKGEGEQSFVVHTNSHNQAYEVRAIGLHTFKQESVLISNNRRHEVKLHNAGGFNTVIGERFISAGHALKGHDNYTVLNGTDFYFVA